MRARPLLAAALALALASLVTAPADAQPATASDGAEPAIGPDPGAVAAARQLLADRAEVVLQLQINDPDLAVGNGDYNASSTVTSTGSEHCTTSGAVVTCTQGSSTSVQGGNLSPSASWRIGNAAERHDALVAQLAAIDAALAAYPSDVLFEARKPAPISLEEYKRTHQGWDWGEIPYIGRLSVTGAILGGGSLDTSSGITGKGGLFEVHGELVMGGHHLGGVFAGEVAVGGYEDHGLIGSIGVDAGVGLHTSWSYLGVTIGGHETASVYSTAPWAPVLAHVALTGPKWGLAIVGGYGWRKALDNPPAGLVVVSGPGGTNASLFRMLIWRRGVQLGFEVSNLDGNQLGSVFLGGGLMRAGR